MPEPPPDPPGTPWPPDPDTERAAEEALLAAQAAWRADPSAANTAALEAALDWASTFFAKAAHVHSGAALR